MALTYSEIVGLIDSSIREKTAISSITRGDVSDRLVNVLDFANALGDSSSLRFGVAGEDDILTELRRVNLGTQTFGFTRISDNATVIYFNQNGIQINDPDTGNTTRYDVDLFTRYISSTGATLSLEYPTLDFDVYAYLPISVDGNYADSTGNITTGGGGVQDLQSVTDEGYITNNLVRSQTADNYWVELDGNFGGLTLRSGNVPMSMDASLATVGNCTLRLPNFGNMPDMGIGTDTPIVTSISNASTTIFADANGDVNISSLVSGGGGGGGSTTFLGLTDTPSSYASQALKIVRVNSGATALEFADFTGWSLTGNSGTSTTTSFIGTTDDQSLYVRVNNIKVARFDNHQSVCIGEGTDAASVANKFPNVFIGYHAGFASSMASSVFDNIAIGWNTFSADKTASVFENIAIGTSALKTFGNGTDNIAIGDTAMNVSVSGTGNVAIGAFAYGYNSFTPPSRSGNNNVFIGYQVGKGNATTGDNNIWIGQALTRDTNTSNTLKIGNAIYGTNIYSGAADTSLIGINTTSPAYSFDVNGSIRGTRSILATSAIPAPVSGNAVLWFDGTNIKGTKNISGSTTTVILDSGGGGGGSSTFIGLTDVPGSFSGAGSKVVRVNSGATALEFVTADSIVNYSVQTITYSATPTLDGSLGTNFKITLTGDVTGLAFSNIVTGKQYRLVIQQDSIGSHTFTFPSNSKAPLGVFDTGTTLRTTSGVSARDDVHFFYDGTNYTVYMDSDIQ